MKDNFQKDIATGLIFDRRFRRLDRFDGALQAGTFTGMFLDKLLHVDQGGQLKFLQAGGFGLGGAALHAKLLNPEEISKNIRRKKPGRRPGRVLIGEGNLPNFKDIHLIIRKDETIKEPAGFVLAELGHVDDQICGNDRKDAMGFAAVDTDVAMFACTNGKGENIPQGGFVERMFFPLHGTEIFFCRLCMRFRVRFTLRNMSGRMEFGNPAVIGRCHPFKLRFHNALTSSALELCWSVESEEE
ncbi:MAG: hypothetical protein P4N60_03120 [Verrucomicrobiae bacterium]|nr:hypothetical protein [Verrucomicrobiae bacterium]